MQLFDKRPRTSKAENMQGKRNMQNEQLYASIAQLKSMDFKTLQNFWKTNFHSEPPGLSKIFLRKRIVFRLQEKEFGGLSSLIAEKMLTIGLEEPRIINAKGFEVGTIFSRIWQGCQYQIIAVEDGFKMNGRKYRSLSGAAFAITGTQWSGRIFWGVR